MVYKNVVICFGVVWDVYYFFVEGLDVCVSIDCGSCCGFILFCGGCGVVFGCLWVCGCCWICCGCICCVCCMGCCGFCGLNWNVFWFLVGVLYMGGGFCWMGCCGICCCDLGFFKVFFVFLCVVFKL